MVDDTELIKLCEQLRSAHGANLVSLVHYGGAVTDAELGGITGLRILVVLDEIEPVDLRMAREPLRMWVDAGNPPPVYFTSAEISDAADVFPIEFLDMMDNRWIVHGTDPFDGLAVSNARLRHQVEFELRGKLIRLRELYSRASDSPEIITALLQSSLGTFGKFFRFALIVAGAPGPASRRDAITAAVRHFGLDVAPFDAILETIASERTLPESEAHECFGTYVRQIERVIAEVDRLPID